MITQEQRDKSDRKRIEILREGYGDNHPEVKAYDQAHPKADGETPAVPDRLSTEEVAVATETVPASPQGKIGGKKPAEDK